MGPVRLLYSYRWFLFLVWKDTKPKTAKAAGIGALVCVVVYVVFYVLMMVLGVGLAAAGV